MNVNQILEGEGKPVNCKACGERSTCKYACRTMITMERPKGCPLDKPKQKASLDSAIGILEAELDSLEHDDPERDEIPSVKRAIKILKGEEHPEHKEDGPSYDDYPGILSHIGDEQFVTPRNRRDSFEENIGPMHGRGDR